MRPDRPGIVKDQGQVTLLRPPSDPRGRIPGLGFEATLNDALSAQP